jgi:hypothetical protein
MGAPAQLTSEQVTSIKSINNGEPTEKKIITIGYSGNYSLSLKMNENDVFLLCLRRL